MLNLTSTSEKLRVVTSGTAAIDVLVAWVDLAAGAVTPGATATAISSAVTTDVVASPAGSTQRNVKALNLRNKDATASNTVTIQWYNGTAYELLKVTLAAGEQLTYLEGESWCVIDAAGGKRLASASGQLLNTSVLTSGTTFTTGPRTSKIFIRLQGGGGGGGGCTSLASAAGAGGGGGSGGYAEKTFVVTPNTAYTYAIGAAGAGVSTADGNAGGNTTFAVGATTVTANGGSGGKVGTAAITLTARLGGAGGAVSTNGDLNGAGAPGEPGIVLIIATPIMVSGAGGSSQFGGGGVQVISGANGNNAAGFGGGGGGSATGASAVRTGGSGTAGVIIVDEYL